LVAGCGPGVEDDIEGEGDSIRNGALASDYPEAVVVDLRHGDTHAQCSGALLAPKVVLTAGHCAFGWKDFTATITAPFAGDKPIPSDGRAIYDYRTSPETSENFDQHDVGLYFLSRPIPLRHYPVVASRRIADGTLTISIGRTRNGEVGSHKLYVGPGLRTYLNPLHPITYWNSRPVVEGGDSGGPVEIPVAHPRTGLHRIVAVNAALATLNGNPIGQDLARVDLVYRWIERQIVAHGGH
jgi:hypothetical protein